jgi:hypothetical protein
MYQGHSYALLISLAYTTIYTTIYTTKKNLIVKEASRIMVQILC